MTEQDDLYKQIIGKISVTQALNQFLLAKETEGITKKTRHFYEDEIRNFAISLMGQGMGIQDVTANMIRQYLVEKAKTRNKGGVHASYRAIRAMFYWYEREFEESLEGAGWHNPVRKLRIPTPAPTAIPGISMSSFNKLLDSCGETEAGIRDRAMFRCLLDSCARASEFIALSIGDVDLTTGDTLIKAGKGGHPRYVMFGSTTRRMLRRYLKTRNSLEKKDPLFITMNGDRFTYNSLMSLLRWRCQQAGIDRPGLHDIRRAGALELLRNGADLSQISRYLGHRSVEVTMRYLAITPDDARAMHAHAGPVDHSLK